MSSASDLLLSLEHTGPTLTVNQALGKHWSLVRDVLRGWRESWFYLGKATGNQIVISDAPVGVEVFITHREVGGIGDAAGHALLAKAAVDGLVDAKVILKDDPTWVSWILFHAPTRGERVPKGMVRLRLDLVPAWSTPQWT